MSGAEFDPAVMMHRKEQIVGTLAQGVETLFKRHKIARYAGRGRFDGRGRILVEGEDERILLEARHIVIATGSKPARLHNVECDGSRIGTSTEALSYPEVPEHLVVIGGGYIGLELGSVWSRAGAKVTVLEALDRILPGADTEIAGRSSRSWKSRGFNFSWLPDPQASVKGKSALLNGRSGSDPLRSRVTGSRPGCRHRRFGAGLGRRPARAAGDPGDNGFETAAPDVLPSAIASAGRNWPIRRRKRAWPASSGS